MKKTGVYLLLLLVFLACQKNKQQAENQEIFQSSQQESETTEPQKLESTTDITDTSTEIEDQSQVEELTPFDQNDAADLSTSGDLWDAYNQVRNNINIYKDNWDYDNLIKSLDEAAQIAIKLNRPDIAAWQYNNMGYYSILEFKKRTDYASRMNDLQIMPYSEEKKQYIQETRDKLRDEFFLLESARENLYDAMEMNSQSPDKEREKIIDSNVNFINTVSEYINS